MPSILQAVPATQGITSCATGDPHHLCHAGPDDERQVCSSYGRGDATDQKSRVGPRRHPLERSPEVGSDRSRWASPCSDHRVEGSSKGSSRRPEGEAASDTARWPRQRRKRKWEERRWKGGFQRRWQEKREQRIREQRRCKEERRRNPKGVKKTFSKDMRKAGERLLEEDGNTGAGERLLTRKKDDEAKGAVYEEGKEEAFRLASLASTRGVDFNGSAGQAQMKDPAETSIFQPGAFASVSPQDSQAMCGSTDSVAGEGHSSFSSKEKSSESAIFSGKTLGNSGARLLQYLLEVFTLRSQTTGLRDKSAIFPLPTSRSKLAEAFPKLRDDELSWLVICCVCLNSYWGQDLFFDGCWGQGVQTCLELLVVDVCRFVRLEERIPELDWHEFFQVRSIDYKGDEVRVARNFSWNNISPALPGDVGNVPLSEVCTLGCRHYVLHFDQYLKPPSEWVKVRAPRVMVDDGCWPDVCVGLVTSGVCVYILEQDVFDTGDGPLLNGLFGVTKDDFTPSGVEIFRLIMNLTPLNALCQPLAGDIDTLPSWSSMHPFHLQPTEGLLVSSEDVKCFFYTMGVPSCWIKFLAFNKLVPNHVLPDHLKGHRVYLSSRVLPMGFLNSVSLAQHVHRNLAQWSGQLKGFVGTCANEPQGELRKDRPMTRANPAWRIYLDNYDLLERVEATSMVSLEGSCPAGVLALRQEYEVWGVPRNEKKAVERSSRCELQGATIDGTAGVAFPRESKLVKYFVLGVKLAMQSRATQRQWQVVCGGLVYFTMFRKQLLGTLNAVWRHIESYNVFPGRYRETPPDCKLELLRFLGLLPLARMTFRLGMNPMVTCSDASTSGGGACASVGLTPAGLMVSQGALRGEFPENRSELSVLRIGLFDGISALRVALDVLGVRVIGHVSVEKSAVARRVVESHFPSVIVVDDVASVDEAMVVAWSLKFSQCNLVLLGAGPPCQGVSGLNSDRRGAMHDERSNLFVHVPRIRGLLAQAFTWCQIHQLMESVASMDAADRAHMSTCVGSDPVMCDAGDLTWCSRPRLYWVTWELFDDEHHRWEDGDPQRLRLHGSQPLDEVIRRGWNKVDDTRCFPTFTTSRPSTRPGRKPAGLVQCTNAELSRWADSHRFPPYQYRDMNCLVNKSGELRTPDISEREMMMGFPVHFTAPCTGKRERGTTAHNDARLTLVGNSWSVPVVSCLLQCLFSPLGFCKGRTPQEIVEACLSGRQQSVQGRLIRLPLNPGKRCTKEHAGQLAFQLANLISIKGEDILLNSDTSQMAKHHRLRASVPGRLWKWRIITGWKWTRGHEHINSLELRAILTTVRWRLEHQHHVGCKFIHLTDSLACLHALTRGRSSSRKIRRTLSRINALLLVSGVQPVWGYIHTDQNPADRPSRWGRRVKTKFKNAT